MLRCCERLVAELAEAPAARRSADPVVDRGGLDHGAAVLRPLLRRGRGRRGGGSAHRGRRGRDAVRRRGAGVAPGPPAAAGPLRRPGGQPPGAVLGRGDAGRRRRGERAWRSPRSGSRWSTTSRCGRLGAIAYALSDRRQRADRGPAAGASVRASSKAVPPSRARPARRPLDVAPSDAPPASDADAPAPGQRSGSGRVRARAAAPARPGLRGGHRLHRPRQLRHQHHRRLDATATCCCGCWWSAT